MRGAKEPFQVLIETMQDALLSLDATGRIQYANPAAARLFGYSTDELQELTITELMSESFQTSGWPLLKAWLEESQPGPADRHWEWSARHRDGGQIEVEISLGENSCGCQRWLTAVIRDVTERKTMRTRMWQTRNLESVAQLAGGVAHHFNNMLTIIRSYVSLLMSDTRLPGDLNPLLKQVSFATDRAAKLVLQLLTFSRNQMIQAQYIDLNELVRDFTAGLPDSMTQEIDWELVLDTELPPLKAEASMIEQILMNLTANAMEAMHGRRRIRIQTGAFNIDSAYANRHPEATEGPAICLQVGDSGCGIDPGALDRVFHPFFTTKDQGYGDGMGLSTVYGIVKLHRGWIEVDSRPGEGTTFKLFFPVPVQMPG